MSYNSPGPFLLHYPGCYQVAQDGIGYGEERRKLTKSFVCEQT